MEYKVKALIVNGTVECASQLCDLNCPNKNKCVQAVLITKEEDDESNQDNN